MPAALRRKVHTLFPPIIPIYPSRPSSSLVTSLVTGPRLVPGPSWSGPESKQKKKRPPGNNKQQITVSQTCRYLELNDYPVSIANHSSEFFADFATFSHFYLPLVASVNPERSRFALETLVHVKWLGLGFKSMAISGNLEQSKAILEAEAPAAAPEAHSAFFTKPKRNKIKLNISR